LQIGQKGNRLETSWTAGCK